MIINTKHSDLKQVSIIHSYDRHKYFFPNGQNFDDFSGFKDTSPISETEKQSLFFSDY